MFLQHNLKVCFIVSNVCWTLFIKIQVQDILWKYLAMQILVLFLRTLLEQVKTRNKRINTGNLSTSMMRVAHACSNNLVNNLPFLTNSKIIHQKCYILEAQ